MTESQTLPVLSEEQRRAVASDAALLVVAAGAGTGKTTTLTARALRLAERSAAEGRTVLAVTFTVAAARDMANRIARLSPHGAESIEVRTLHAWAYRACREWGVVPHGAGWLLAEREAMEWLCELLAEGPSVALPPGHRHPDEPMEEALFRLFQRWGENGVDSEDARQRSRLSFPSRVWELYAAYQARKRLEGRGDFSDLIQLATQWLQQEAASPPGGRYGHILVDEAQDLNTGQIALLRALSVGVDSLTLVGDDDQSLYAFRGAASKVLDHAERWFPEIAARGTERVVLRDHRRCVSGVVEKALRLVNLNTRARPKELVAVREGPPPAGWRVRDEREEGEFVAWRVAKLLAGGAAPETIAVLARTSAALSSVEASLIARRIPVARRDGGGLLESSVARDVIAWLSLATSPDALGAFLRVHARPPRGVGRLTAQRVVALAERSDLALRDAMDALARAAVGEERGALQAFGEVLDALDDARASHAAPAAFLEDVLRISGYAEWIAAHGSEEEAERLDLLRRIAEAAADVDDVLVTVCVSHSDDWVEGAGRVALGTLHGAKGLEWDHVFLVGAHARALPHVSAIEEFDIVRAHWPVALLRPDPLLTIGRGGIEEERRLFHVGLTRARQTATVTCPAAVIDKGRRLPVMPSPFLAEAGISLAEPPAEWRRLAAVRGPKTRAVATWRRRGTGTPSSEREQLSLW